MIELKTGSKLPWHEDIKDLHRNWLFWKESYNVGPNYLDTKDERNNPVLKPFDCEDRINFKERKKRTSPRNLVGRVVNQYVSAVFRNEPERDDRLGDLIVSADGRGKSLSNTMKDSLQGTLIKNFSPILLENRIGGVMSLAQAREAEQSIRILNVDASAIINWTEIDGYLLDILVSFVDEEGKPFLRYYTDETITDVFVDKKMERIESIGEPIPHGFSQIPVIIPNIELGGESFVQPLAHSQSQITNYLSLLSQELYENCFTRFALGGIESLSNMTREERDNIQLEWGSKRLLMLPDSISVSRMASDKSQADSIREAIVEETEELFRNAGLIQDAVGMNASGESRSLARENFNMIARNMSQTIEGAENKVIDLIGDVTGVEYEQSSYSESFAEFDYSEDILQLRDILSLDLGSENDEIKGKAIEEFKNRYFI